MEVEVQQQQPQQDLPPKEQRLPRERSPSRKAAEEERKQDG